MAKQRKDEYSNVAFGEVTMSATDALTFDAIQMAVGTFQGVAMIIHRILYYPTGSALRQLVGGTDFLGMALTGSNRLAAISEISDPAVIDMIQLTAIGVAVESYRTPLVSDFTRLPGNGKIISANPLYIAAVSSGFAAAATVRVQLDFTFIELADKDYIELIQAQLPANIG